MLLVASNAKNHRVTELEALVDGRTTRGDDDCIAELFCEFRRRQFELRGLVDQRLLKSRKSLYLYRDRMRFWYVCTRLG